MPSQDVSTLIFVCVWSLAAVGVGLVCGFFIGRFHALANGSKKLNENRESTLKAIMQLMSSTDQLNVDVDEHNMALASAQQELQTIEHDAEHGKMHDNLLTNITRVVESNRRLENDLVVSRYQLDNQAQELDESRREARTDVLCNVGNRKAVDETLQYMVSRFKSDQESFGLMLIDVDHFKRVNDTFGHVAGDEVLTSIALALKDSVRPTDFVGRLGGDEFVLLLPGLGDKNAQMVGERIKKSIELCDFSINDKGQSTVVTLSMGLAIVRTEDSTSSLYERADKALYKSKSSGRNRLFTLLSESMGDGDMPVREKKPVDSYESFKASFSTDA